MSKETLTFECNSCYELMTMECDRPEGFIARLVDATKCLFGKGAVKKFSDDSDRLTEMIEEHFLRPGHPKINPSYFKPTSLPSWVVYKCDACDWKITMGENTVDMLIATIINHVNNNHPAQRVVVKPHMSLK